MNKVVDASVAVCTNTTERVDKLISDAITFMNNFQISFESNTMKANEAIANLSSSLKTEREKLLEVRTGITSDHEEFKSTISSEYSKLQEDLGWIAEKQVKDLLYERLVMKRSPASLCFASSFRGCFRIKQHHETRGRLAKEAISQTKNKSEYDPKGKEKILFEEPIVDNSGKEELDEDELKRRKACEAELDENQRIVREAEAKEKAKRSLGHT
ncbi:unnamed protein product [Lactuca saligna]|uniref:Uncharacterized protein n=1 Tax=Lactuca saligna TaxID=75948 RepID=A0AA35UXR2_LACSI|nr:unnamed protein product [Lactuca saligna]